MTNVYKISWVFTRNDVLRFAEITEDNGPVHTLKGTVQGGYILSLLPNWLKQCGLERALLERNKTVSLSVSARFRDQLPSDVEIDVIFEIVRKGTRINKLNWKITRLEKIYCDGEWTLCGIEIDEN